MKPALHHSAITAGYRSVDHTRRPGLFDHWMDWVLLLIVAAGDFANFSIVIARSDGQLSWSTALVLTLSMTAAAVLLMHKAGQIARDVKANASPLKPLVGKVMIGLWLLMGLVSFWLRVTSAEGGDAGGFTGAAEVAATDLPFAVIMLVVYLAGGAAAYAIGFLSFNPLRTEVLRAQRRVRWASWRLARAIRGQQKAAAVDPYERAEADLDLHLAEVESQAARLRAEVAPALRAARLRVLEERAELAGASLAQAVDARSALDEELALLDARLEPHHREVALADETATAAAQAAQLRHLARLGMASELGDPGATTGLFTTVSPNA